MHFIRIGVKIQIENKRMEFFAKDRRQRIRKR
jgi:hypothetical protein